MTNPTPEETPAPRDEDPAEEAVFPASDEPEAWEDDELDVEALPQRRPTTMRHPLILVAVIAGAAFMFWKSWPGVDFMLRARDVADCGNVSDRPFDKAKAGGELPPLGHDTWCHLEGTVQSLGILATGTPRDTTNPYTRDADRKYYLKLSGDKVFAVLDGGKKDVVDFRERHNGLLGYQVKSEGRVIDPDAEPGFKATARTLRLKFSVPDDVPIRLFDTTDTPGSRWPQALICSLMAFTALLALFGLVRLLLRRRAAS